MTATAPPAPRYRIRDLPGRTSLFRFIAENSDLAVACLRTLPRRPARGLIGVGLRPALFEGLRIAAREVIARHGPLAEPDGPYVSLSLTYNPDGKAADPGAYAFRLPTDAARIGALGEFLSECRLSLVRSRLALLPGPGAAPFDRGWRRDEPVFEHLRLHIPLGAPPGFCLQVERERDRPLESSCTMTTHELEPGRAYTWDTHRPYRVYAADAGAVDQLQLVLGFSPWLRYDRESDAWEPNEFYGRLHPFDIVRSGALHPALKTRS